MKDAHCPQPGAPVRQHAKRRGAAFVAALLLASPALAQPAPPPAGLPMPGNAAPATSAPAGAELPSGAPMASMLQNQSDNRAAPRLPLSTQPMTLDTARSNQVLGQMDRQVSDRLAGLRLGEGPLVGPDVSPYRGELEGMAEEQRQIRLLQLRQQRAELARKLWETLYDPRREEDAARTGGRGEGRQAEAARAAVSSEAVAPAAPAAPVAELPYPKVVSIEGGLGALHAVLLVPYVGEVTASLGTPLPGGRRVTRISADGVTVDDPLHGRVPLGYGDMVPLMPTTMANPAANGMPMMGMPQMAMPQAPMPQPPTPPPSSARPPANTATSAR